MLLPITALSCPLPTHTQTLPHRNALAWNSIVSAYSSYHTLLLYISYLLYIYAFFCVTSHTQLMLCLPFLVVPNHRPVNDCSSFANC